MANIKNLGTWGLALVASVALHVLVIGTMFGMNGCGGSGDIPELPPVPQTDGRANDLPASATESETPAVAETPAPAPVAAKEPKETKKPPKKPAKASETADAPAPAGWKTYKVKAGDSLTRLARQSGVTVQELAKVNGLSPSASLMLGQTLKIKDVKDAPAE